MLWTAPSIHREGIGVVRTLLHKGRLGKLDNHIYFGNQVAVVKFSGSCTSCEIIYTETSNMFA
jgi:hypothetical protein